MSPEEIQAMAKGLAQGQAIWYLASALIGGAITGLTAYVAEKSKNRATKQDIKKLTLTVQTVELEFKRQLEDIKAHHQLRMVAAEKRIQAHQEAYEFGVKLQKSITLSDNEWDDLYEAAEHWHIKNYLFLGENSRKDFIFLIHKISKYRSAIKRMENNSLNLKPLEEWEIQPENLFQILDQEIMPLFQTITSEAQLPPLNTQHFHSTLNISE